MKVHRFRIIDHLFPPYVQLPGKVAGKAASADELLYDRPEVCALLRLSWK